MQLKSAVSRHINVYFFHAEMPIKTETINFLIAKFYINSITKTVNSMILSEQET